MDRMEYVDLFSSEAGEYLQILNRCALRLEKEPEHMQSIQEAFRAVHSLKGMAGTMGYGQITEITHSLENLLEDLKSGNVYPNTVVMDVLFEAIDMLQGALANPEQDDRQGKNRVEKIADKIRHICLFSGTSDKPDPNFFGEIGFSLSETDRETIRAAKEKNQHIFAVNVRLSEHAPMKSVRSYMVIKKLLACGDILASDPSFQDLEDENFDCAFQVVLAASRSPGKKMCKELLNITDVEDVEINPWKDAAVTGEVERRLSADLRGGGDEGASQRDIDKLVRVETTKLDQLVNLVGEMVVARTRVLELGRGHSEELDNLLEQMRRSISNLQDIAMKLRLVPINQVFDRFPRMVRDISRSLGKKVRLMISGEQTELDRSIVNRLSDPLVHLIRNSIDHGIESEEVRKARGKKPEGTVLLKAYHEGNHIVILVEDDGGGIDPQVVRNTALKKGIISPEESSRLSEQEMLNLIFLSGLSTSSQITDISGRGVGMDVVKASIEALHGSIRISSRISEMTRFSLRIPLTLAIINSLLVKAAGQILAIPIEAIEENIFLEQSEIKTVCGKKAVNLRDEAVFLHSLGQMLGFPENACSELPGFPVVIVEAGGKKAGLIVEELIGQQEIMIKPLGNYLGGLNGIAGATILGNGRVTLIVDVLDLLS